MRPAQAALQDRYWSQARFRTPNHPVSVAYAEPKLDFLETHAPLAGRDVLEVACGNGVFTRGLAARSGSLVVTDRSASMLGQNRHDLRLRSDATRLPFADGAFDAVFAANLLHHVSDISAVLGEFARCSRRHVLLVEPNRWNPLMLGFGLLVPAERGLLKFSRRTVTRWVEAAGLRVVAATVTGMISQNNTPAALVPWLKRFDRELAWGEYVVLCAERA